MKFYGLIVFLFWHLSWARSVVSLRETTKVKGVSQISLYDICDSQSLNLSQTEVLKQTIIFPFWKAGMKVTLTNDEVSNLLKPLMRSKGGRLDEFHFKIPSQVEISEETLGLESKAIEQQITEKVAVQCTGCLIKISSLKIPHLPKIDPGVSWEIDFKNFKTGGAFTLPLYVYFGDMPQTYWVSGLIEVRKEAPVATRSLMYGERLQAADMEVKSVDVTYVKEPVPWQEELLGQVLLKPLQVGQVILRSFLKKEPIIQKGQQARVVSQVNGFEVSAQVVAEENGFVGEIIKLKNPENQKILTGKVIEKGLVRIE